MNIFTTLLLLIPLASPLPPQKCQCRKVKDESPVSGTAFGAMNGGRVKKLQGVVLYPDGTVMKDAVVEVFENRARADDENISSDEVTESTSRKRKTAWMTGEDGRFCLSNLRPGRYLLRIGHRSDHQFSAMHVVVTLDPRGRNKDLEVRLNLSI